MPFCLGNFRLGGASEENGITMRPVNWSALNNAWIQLEPKVDSSQKTLIADLFDTLGQLGVRTFGHRITNDMKADSPKNAAQCAKILSDAAGKINFDPAAWSLNPTFEDPTSWTFGVDVRRRKKGNGALTPNHEHLINIIEPSGEPHKRKRKMRRIATGLFL